MCVRKDIVFKWWACKGLVWATCGAVGALTLLVVRRTVWDWDAGVKFTDAYPNILFVAVCFVALLDLGGIWVCRWSGMAQKGAVLRFLCCLAVYVGVSLWVSPSVLKLRGWSLLEIQCAILGVNVLGLLFLDVMGPIRSNRNVKKHYGCPRPLLYLAVNLFLFLIWFEKNMHVGL